MKQYLRDWGVSSLVILMLSFSAFAKLSGHPEVHKVMSGLLGFPATTTFGIGVLEAACVLLYAIPRTALLGAVLLTGYLGGAIAAHLRDPFISPLIAGAAGLAGDALASPVGAGAAAAYFRFALKDW